MWIKFVLFQVRNGPEKVMLKKARRKRKFFNQCNNLGLPTNYYNLGQDNLKFVFIHTIHILWERNYRHHTINRFKHSLSKLQNSEIGHFRIKPQMYSYLETYKVIDFTDIHIQKWLFIIFIFKLRYATAKFYFSVKCIL